MRLVTVGTLALVVCLCGSCAKYWYQEGQSFRQTQRDLSACQGEAVRYSDVGRTYGLGSYEQEFVAECMQKKGYQLVPEKELPKRVKRQSSPVFGLPGIAGTID
jgi:hypothetical protein